MKIVNSTLPKSSFMAMEKDLAIITDGILKNKRIQKLLYYTTKDAMSRPNLTEEEAYSLMGKNVKIVPKLYVDGSVLAYIIVSFDNFSPNSTNPQFRNSYIHFDIICHFNQWTLDKNELRPYRIAAELDTMFNEKHMTGIGKLQFVTCSQLVLNDEFAGLSMMYEAIHGGEDKNYNKDERDLLDPVDEQQFIEDYNELYNSDEWTLD